MESVRGRSRQAAVDYHLLFDYPLTGQEMKRWRAGEKVKKEIPRVRVAAKKLKDLRVKREINRRASERKVEMARRAAELLARILTVKMVAMTGSLAMGNARPESDIDLMIITSRGRLWLTRLLGYGLLRAKNYELRRPNDENEKDKLCLNLWMEEGDLKWRRRSAFDAHEICQIVPLVNKEKTHEKLLGENRWVLDYWPKAVKIPKPGSGEGYPTQFANKKRYGILDLLNKIAFLIQYQYMRRKITREVVSLTRAVFHPIDWSARIKDSVALGS